MTSLIIMPEPAFSQTRFLFRTTEQVYNPGETLTIYGAGEPDDTILVRLFDPAGRAIKLDNISIDEEGFFRESIFKWPEPSRNLPFGTYTIEAVSAASQESQEIELTFAESLQQDEGVRIPRIHILDIKLESPDQITVKVPFRIFVQVTYDGALVNVDDAQAISELLGSSHVHLGRGNTTIILADKFIKLHEGLYYADVTIQTEGTYVIHAIVFNRGLLSHDSKVVSASLSSISTIQESVAELDEELNKTNQELQRVQEGLDETRSALNDTKSAITSSVVTAEKSIGSQIGTMQEASGQINALILPVLALISVIIALQISLFARIRASYK
ncbi:MAG: hypothetical protein ACRD98_04415 [Nitrososphaera sp.]